jgi:transposase
MRGPEEQRAFRLGWSLFRRAHQAAAKRSHEAAHQARYAAASYHDDGLGGHELEPADSSGEGKASRRTPLRADRAAGLLSDDQWERVRELLPRQTPGEGRPRRDDRQVLCGILWIMESGSSWRDLPEEEFGPNSTLHGRYRKWCEEGLWPRIVEALGQ